MERCTERERSCYDSNRNVQAGGLCLEDASISTVLGSVRGVFKGEGPSITVRISTYSVEAFVSFEDDVSSHCMLFYVDQADIPQRLNQAVAERFEQEGRRSTRSISTERGKSASYGSWSAWK